MKIIRKSFYTSLSIALFSLPFIPIQSVFAEQSFKVDPIKETIFLEPGSTAEIELVFSNNAITGREIDFRLSEFTVDESYTPIEVEPADENSPVNWFSGIEEAFELAGGEQKVMALTINVPANAAEQGYYVDAISSVGAIGEQAAANTARQEFHTLYSLVVGEPTETIRIEEIQYEDGFLFITVDNPASVHSSVSGEVQIFIGTEEVTQATVRSNNVFPGKQRTLRVALEEIQADQEYQAEVNLAYGRNVRIANGSAEFRTGSNLVDEVQSSSEIETSFSDDNDKNNVLLYSAIGGGAAVLILVAGTVLVISRRGAM